MIDVRANSIIYQSQIYYRDLINDLVSNKRLGKALDSKWEKADTILGYLEAWQNVNLLSEDEDITNANFILYCLIELCELNRFPFATPLAFSPAPAVIVGVKGDKGDDGDPGSQGPTGLATDFQVSLVSVPTVVDSFNITDAKAARWDYYASNGTAQRASSIIGHWLADGSSYELFDLGADDIGGSTEGLEFDIQIIGTTVQLLVIPPSGLWTIVGSRYFIPNNGNGSGPISNVLTNGRIYIGNTLNQAQERDVSGVINIDNTGLTVFGSTAASGILNILTTNVDALVNIINNNATVSLNANIPAVAINRILISNGVGLLEVSPTSSSALLFLDASSSIQTQLNNKQTLITGAASTATTNNFTGYRTVITNSEGKLVPSDTEATNTEGSDEFNPGIGFTDSVGEDITFTNTIQDMALTLKTKIQNGSGNSTFTAGVKGSRIYSIQFLAGTTTDNVTLTEGSETATLIDADTTVTRKNYVNITDLPGIPTEKITDIPFYPVGAGIVVSLVGTSGGSQVVVTYVDLE